MKLFKQKTKNPYNVKKAGENIAFMARYLEKYGEKALGQFVSLLGSNSFSEGEAIHLTDYISKNIDNDKLYLDIYEAMKIENEVERKTYLTKKNML